ncbi:Crp/Fnr family transcriptional regulator [Thermus scotoductus]|uniref:Crp/Fnr family transcriptional regulator n=1 Tax=Thermus scotoductus TaxID=37636 RepID=A0A430R6G7_THESC|nr:Crp/Fnr family transcriptional regulator [Thermus scotoductus]RTG96895.1 Crp/Fnr family transcriptional regulator [Thermus scotoductus]RTH03022.1 Crp/Fnr family transcriptional regulator [Thermus scotoductus]RTH26370.1 Crp/Fnr family transcriptional regulator [Thermus scotoductus]RTH33092.1 Crp/Fnr family transcriptional regulator [Thermus scotoductus]RTI03706.1 Crp/Fnr family transcriptional regulator [Thermus scotoductus]
MDLKQVPLFRDLNPEDLKALEGEARARRLKRGEVLFLEGEPVHSLFVVEKGLIKVYKLDPEGRKQVVLHLEGPGRVLAEVALFLDRPTYPASAEALEESQVLAIPKERFFQLAEARPPLARALIRYLARRQGQLLHLLDRLVFHEVRERLAEYLLETLATEGQGFLLPTNSELAALLGTVPEAVSRNLGELYRQGLIRLQGRRVYVDRLEDLRSLLS